MASPRENVTLGWLPRFLCKGHPELPPAHVLPSLQADCSCPHHHQAAVPQHPGDLCSPQALGFQLWVTLSAWHHYKIKLPQLTVDQQLDNRRGWHSWELILAAHLTLHLFEGGLAFIPHKRIALDTVGSRDVILPPCTWHLLVLQHQRAMLNSVQCIWSLELTP